MTNTQLSTPIRTQDKWCTHTKTIESVDHVYVQTTFWTLTNNIHTDADKHKFYLRQTHSQTHTFTITYTNTNATPTSTNTQLSRESQTGSNTFPQTQIHYAQSQIHDQSQRITNNTNTNIIANTDTYSHKPKHTYKYAQIKSPKTNRQCIPTLLSTTTHNTQSQSPKIHKHTSDSAITCSITKSIRNTNAGTHTDIHAHMSTHKKNMQI